MFLLQVVADNELGGLKQALDGKFVEPGPGGDPIRNPKVLPTGKNIHALDPQAIPTAAALQSAKVIVERLLERQKVENGGKYPETVALVLWGTDNIKTYGESLAQVLQVHKPIDTVIYSGLYRSGPGHGDDDQGAGF